MKNLLRKALKPSKWKWHEDMEPHYCSFANTVNDMSVLRFDHASYLAENAKDGIVHERDTVYLRSAYLLVLPQSDLEFSFTGVSITTIEGGLYESNGQRFVAA